MPRLVGLSALVLAVLLAGCGGSSSSKHPTSPPAQAPVVATSFTNLRPAAGHRETVQVQFFEGTHRLSGGRLSVTITYGKHAIHVTGSATDRHGMASATFTVPHGAGGTVLHALTAVRYKGRLYRGSNQVEVKR